MVSGAVAVTYNLPFSPATLKYGTYPSLVLGENGTAFATDGADTTHGPQVISFNLSTGSVNWSYQATAQSALTMLAVTSDGGIAVNNSQNGVLQLSPSGAASQLTASLGGIAQYSWSGNWFIQGSQDAASLTLPIDVDPAAIWATPKGNPIGAGFLKRIMRMLATVNLYRCAGVRAGSDGISRHSFRSSGVAAELSRDLQFAFPRLSCN